MKFTRFVDLGGRQTDLYVYTAEPGASPWMIIRIKCVMRSDQGECIQVFVSVAGKPNRHEETLVSPEVWKLPALADRILTFAKNDLLTKVAEGGAALAEGGGAGSPESGTNDELESGASDDEDDFDDLDTAGILAGDGGGAEMDFNPEDVIAQANESGGDEDMDPSDLIGKMNEESAGMESDEVDDPSSLIQRENEAPEDEEDK